MTSSDRKELRGLARSIDHLFQDRDASEVEASATADEAETPEVTSNEAPEATDAPEVVEVPEALESAEATDGSVPDAPEATDSTVREATQDVVWEATPPREGPGRQPKPDVVAFGNAIDAFLASDPLARDGQAREIREMAAALRETGSLDALADAAERLAVQDDDDEACLAMAQALVTPAVASRLAARLGAGREEERRAQLIGIFQRIGHEMALAISDALSDTTDRYARRVFMEAMVALGQEGMLVVEQMMEDPRWFVVRNAVAILGEVGGDRAVELLTTSLAHSDPRVRREGLRSLARVGGEDAGMLVYGMIEDTDPEVRLAAAVAAGELKIERALKPLLALLDQERDDDVLVGVLHALGQLGDPGAVNAIEKRAVGSFFSRPSAAVRIAAYHALYKIGTPHAKSLLVRAMNDKNTEVRRAVRQLLGQ